MKHSLRKGFQVTIQIRIVIIIAALALNGWLHLNASETSASWDGLSIGLSIPKTNFVLGDKITASIVISNTVKKEHIVRWQTGDVCNCGFGTFDIFDISSGKQIECKFSREERGHIIDSGSIHLQPHKTQAFGMDLMNGYAITNAGLYSIKAVRWFPVNEPPTNHLYTNIITPPIVISLLPKPEANVPPK